MRLPNVFIPVVIGVFAVLCLPLREVFNVPAARMSLGESQSVDGTLVRTAEMIVQGVKCKGTAEYFLSRYEGQEGILGLEAYAADHRVVVTYDISKIDGDRIRAIGDAPVQLRTGEFRKLFSVQEFTDQ